MPVNGYTQTTTSLVPRPSIPPVCDCLQYAKTEGEGARPGESSHVIHGMNVICRHASSQQLTVKVMYGTNLAFCASYEDVTSANKELH